MNIIKKLRKRVLPAAMAGVLMISPVMDSVVGLTQVQAAEMLEGFIEVSVPNGDFEKSETEWKFTGNGTSDADTSYWRVFNNTGDQNKSKVYEVCNHGDAVETYTCSQTVKGLEDGIYCASVDAMGGNDPGTHTTTLTAGGESVSVTPGGWNTWNTYTTDTFMVTGGTCEIVISSTVKKQYVNLDNVKLYRMNDGSGREVQSISPVSEKVKTGATFTAPTKAKVLFTDGTSAKLDVKWDQTELSKVVTNTAATFLVHGKVNVNGTDYDATMTVSVLDGSELTQKIPEDAQGSIDFNTGWQFYLATRTPQANGNFATGGVKDAGEYSTNEIIATDFDDTSWRTVDVPHDFSIEGEKTTASNDSQGYLQGGLAYYRKTFEVPSNLNNKRIIIDFESVYQNAVVYLNGNEIGNYPSGYTGFAFDITDKIVYGGKNVLVVKVQNMSPSGRWYTGSGIIRPVHLMVENSARFSRNGITLSTPDLKDDIKDYSAAYMNIEATGQTEDSNSNVYMEVAVYDKEGKEVAKKKTANTALNAGAFNLKLNELEISDPELWYPWNLGEPYLYTVKASLYQEKNGTDAGYVLVDEEEMEYGFRYFEVAETTNDANSGGLYINGKYTKIQGVDLHHDSGALGAASYSDAYERQFDKLMDMGVNAYRTAHCPPSKQIIEVCRRKGILVLEEAFDGWGAAKASYDFGNFFLQEVPGNWAGLYANGLREVPKPGIDYNGAKYVWSDWVLREMVQRDKNEPSVIAWSIGNEVRGAGSLPNWYKPEEYDILSSGSKNSTYTEAVRLAADVRTLDSTRLVVTGTDNERGVPGAKDEYGLVNQVLDGLGLNYNTAKSVDQLINRYSIGDGTLYEKASKTFFFESESSSQTSSRGVYLDPQFSNTGINQTPGSRGGSSYDNDFASWTMSNEYGLKKDRDRKSFIGQFIWTGFDYIGEPTPYSVYPVGVAAFGTIDTAGFEKDSFYLYKSQWIKPEDEPMVHLLPMDWDSWEEGETVTVWVNTNLQSAELFLNGKSLGKKSFDEKETAYGKKYYETSEKTNDDKTWGDGNNSDGYTSNGAVLDGGETNYGKLHLTWEVPYEAGKLEVVAYDQSNQEAARDSIETSDIPYTIDTEVSKTVLAADGSSLSYVECTVVDEKGNMVANADDIVKFDVEGPVSIVGVDNGKQESNELYKWENVDKNTHSERSAYHGKVLVILKSERTEGDAVLTVSANNLKTTQVKIKVTKDGNDNAEVTQPEITGTATSVDPVEITVPAGMIIDLPKNVKVNYTSSAGNYSVLRPVEWKAVSQNESEGTIEGVDVKAKATIIESQDAATDVELATNKALGENNAAFKFADLKGNNEAQKNALATATFTGSVENYPNNMLDGNADTSWTNAYSRSESVLLPANSASRKSDRVEFYWNEKKLLNQVSLSFVRSKSVAIPSELQVEYWDGGKWRRVNDQTTTFATETKAPTIMQFEPVYTERIRVYMVNEKPFTSGGNIEIVEASAMLSSTRQNVQVIMEADKTKVDLGETFTVTGKLSNNLDADEALLQSVSFILDYDKTAFSEPTVALVENIPGTLTNVKDGDDTVWTYTNEGGIPTDIKEFITATYKVNDDVESGNYIVKLSSLEVKNVSGDNVSVATRAAVVNVVGKEPVNNEENQNPDVPADGNMYTVTFDSAGGNSVEKQTIAEGGIVKKPADPNREGYTFDGWYLGEEKYDFSSKVNSNLSLVAKWTEVQAEVTKFTVTFNSNGGTLIDNQIVAKGEKVEKPADPVRDGYIFRGWYLDGIEYDFNAIVTKNIVFYAVWGIDANGTQDPSAEHNYSITFNSDGGSLVKNQMVKEGERAVKPEDPTKDGYIFKGWYDGAAVYNFDKEVTENIVLTAKWEAATQNGTNPGNNPGGNNPQNPGNSNSNNNNGTGTNPGNSDSNNNNGTGTNPGNSDSNNNNGTGTNPGDSDSNNNNGTGTNPDKNNGTGTNPGVPTDANFKEGVTFVAGKLVYKITKVTADAVEVQVLKPVKNTNTSITIPNTVSYSGKECKVTSIAKNAFKNNKKLKKVTISANVVSIGEKAFYNCVKLNQVTFKKNKLNSVGKNAFLKTAKNLKIKTGSKSNIKEYSKLLKKKVPAKAKITK